jgi:hypothetical protein
MTPRWQRGLRALISPAGLIIVGLLMRFVHLLTLGNQYFFGDTPEYQQAATRLLHGTSSSAMGPRAPLYPLFMALSFRLGGEGNFVVTRLLQLVFALGLMLLMVRFARRTGGPGAGGVAALGGALAPTLLFVAGLLYPTILYTLLLFAATLLAWELSERPSLARGALLGVLAVLGWLTDMVFLAPLAFIGLWLLACTRTRGRTLAPALVTAGATVVILATPYVAHLRSLKTDRVFMGKAQAVLHFARTDPALSTHRFIRMAPNTPFVALSPGAFLGRERRLLAERPWAYAHDYAMEYFHFFQPIPDRVSSVNRYNTPVVLLAGGIYFVALLTLAVLGLLCGAGPLRARVLLAGIVMATAAFYAFFFTQARYRIPIEPHLIALAALGVARAFPRVTRFLAGPGVGGVPEDPVA